MGFAALNPSYTYTAAMNAAPLQDFDESQARATGWLAAWDRQGIHRLSITHI